MLLSSPAIMPDSLETRSMAASARMNRATQVVTRLAFRFLETLLACLERSHDSTPLGLAHRRPACDLVDGAPAADAQPRLAVEQADIDARSLQGNLARLMVPETYVGAAAAPSNRVLEGDLLCCLLLHPSPRAIGAYWIPPPRPPRATKKVPLRRHGRRRRG